MVDWLIPDYCTLHRIRFNEMDMPSLSITGQAVGITGDGIQYKI